MNTTNTHPKFEFLNTRRIDTLDLTIEHYQHIKTKAQHYHLASERNENVFMLAFRTLPQDSTGVAHILEHTALCGSQRFPVRDPFFMMIRRSLNTFMNAFTSSDWTAYPFATQNPKDFDHLLQVYLDAAFFSRLDPLDFAQEGHRVEFSEPQNPDSELVYKGVVYNEMKGAMSSINATLWQQLCKHLQPGTTYQHNSGGDPANIPELSHRQLLAFYRKHYHPSNSIIMTSGNITAAQHHQRIDELALQHFDLQPTPLRAERQKRFTKPQSAHAYYPYTATESASEQDSKHHFLLAWMLGSSSSLDDALQAQLIAGVLLENSAAPLMHYLETTSLGSAPSALSGVDQHGREIIFSCGIEGARKEDAEHFEQQVLQLLQQIVSDGLEHELLESVLHQIELGQREVTGSSYPYGLSLMLSALPGALHDGDPAQLLDIDGALNKLRKDIQNPDFIKQLISQQLLTNNHRLRLVVSPDAQLSEHNKAQEQQRLAALKQRLSTPDKQKIIQLSSDLNARQQQQDDASVLPKLELKDIPTTITFPASQTLDNELTFYPQPTNGLVYQDIRITLPQLDATQLTQLPLLCSCLTELGAGTQNYLETQQQLSAHTGGVSAFYQIRQDQDQRTRAYWGLSAKALNHKHAQLCELQHAFLNHTRFDEQQRIRELIQQMRASAEKSVTGNGHSLAMLAASSHLSSFAGMQHQLSGLASISALKALDKRLADETALEQFCNQLEALYQHIQGDVAKLLIVGEATQRQTMQQQLSHFKTAHDHEHLFSIDSQHPQQQLWLAETQVNFCAKAFPSVSFTHPDAPALTVLASFLRNGFLHRSIREQGGAYGGGATQDNRHGLFKFYSYRDPRLVETLNDFDASIQWVLEHQHTQQSLKEAIFTVIASIDKPSSPAGEARQDYNSQLFGISHQQQSDFRQGVLQLSIEDLQRVANDYLLAQQDKASSAILSSEKIIAEHQAALSHLAFERYLL